MSPKLIQLIADQTGRELLAHHTYLSLGLWCASAGFEGAATWFQSQATEERGHMVKQLAFLNDYADVPPAVPSAMEERLQPVALADAFAASLALELQVTDALNQIAKTADEEGAQEVEAFFNWFLTEQISSVSQIRTILRRLQFAGNNPAAILAIDQSLGDQE